MAKRRAEVVVEELVSHGVRRSCLEGVAGGADDTAGVDIDLGFYDEEPQREELSIVLVEKGDDESSVTSPWRPGDPRRAAHVLLHLRVEGPQVARPHRRRARLGVGLLRRRR